MKVKLINYTPDAEKLIASSGRLCYSPVGIEEIQEDITEETIERMVNMFVETGHGSTLEHVSFTFGIEGVSRIVEQQLTRHRVGASYSIQSSRYVNRDNFEYVIPKSLLDYKEPLEEENGLVLSYYNEFMDRANDLYDHLVNTVGIKKEDARYILPQGMATKFVLTMNARALLHFFSLRSCRRAQPEIVELADKMIIELKKIYPILFKNAGASCISGKCPEGNMSCGNPRSREEYEVNE